MDCNIFTENLYKFIEDDLEVGMAKKMQEHMLQCEACRQIYNEELLIEKAFSEALNVDDVIFNSQKEQIMNKINKNAYMGYKQKPTKIGLFASFKIVTPIAAAVLFIALLNPISRFNILEGASSSKSESNQYTASDNDSISNGMSMKNTTSGGFEDSTGKGALENYEVTIKDDASNQINKDKANSKMDGNLTITSKEPSDTKEITSNNLEATSEPASEPDGISSEKPSGEGEVALKEDTSAEGDNNIKINSITGPNIETTKKVVFNKGIISDKNINESLYKWIKSPDNKLAATLAEKTDSSLEKIYISNLDSKEVWSLEENFESRSVYTKFIKWADNEKLFVIINEVSDNNIINEEVYLLNVLTGSTTKVYRIEGNINSVVDIDIVNKVDIQLKITGPEDDNINRIYLENFTK